MCLINESQTLFSLTSCTFSMSLGKRRKKAFPVQWKVLRGGRFNLLVDRCPSLLLSAGTRTLSKLGNPSLEQLSLLSLDETVENYFLKCKTFFFFPDKCACVQIGFTLAHPESLLFWREVSCMCTMLMVQGKISSG